MSHCVGKWTLKQALFSHSLEERTPIFQMRCQVVEHLVEADRLLVKRWQGSGPVMSSDEESTRITKHACHVTKKLRRSAYTRGRAEVIKFRRRSSEGFLRSIGKRGEKVTE